MSDFAKGTPGNDQPMVSQGPDHRRAKQSKQVSQSPVRLLDVHKSSQYLGVSPSLIRAYLASGHLHQVLLPDPGCSARVIRRVLIDIRELDAFVESRETHGS